MKFLITVFLPASPFIPISPFINFRDFCQPPRLLFWPKFTSFPVYSALPFYLKLESTSIRLHVEQIFYLNIEYTSFFNFGRGFFWACDSFTILFPKVPAYCGKRNWNNFCCIVLLFVWAQTECLIFLKSYFKLEILIFLSFAVSFLVDMFN